MTDEQRNKIRELRFEGNGYKKIGALLGLSRDSVRSFCKSNKLEGNSNVIALNINEKLKRNVLCINCKKPIEQKAKGRVRKFCSNECRHSWWDKNRSKGNRKAFYKYKCKNCNKDFEAYGNKKRQFCSHDCFISFRFGKENEDGV